MTQDERQPLTSEERDRRVLDLCERVSEIEQRLIPTGLHVFGRPSGERECADLLRMVASFDRPDDGVRALPTLIEEGLTRPRANFSPDSVAGGGASAEETLRARELIDATLRESIAIFLREGTGAALRWLGANAGVASDDSRPAFELLSEVHAQLQTNG
ncbi:MAG: hypothetical protein LC785_16245, partial [Acidobacteria bacterium]|nr:hypothetical protein [Acidobacteriota bacterium]